MKFSKNSIIILLLITVIIVISYFNFSSGNYLKVLEKNMTSLKTSLEGCKNEISSLKNDLNVCNQDLNTCEDNLDSKTQLLISCQSVSGECENKYMSLQSNYTRCEEELNDFKDFLDEKNLDDLSDLRERWSNLNNDLDECLNNLGDYNELKNNYVHYKCCVANTTVYQSYDVNNNEVYCRNNTSGEFTLTC